MVYNSILKNKKILIVLITAAIVRVIFFILVMPYDRIVETTRIIRSDAIGYNNLAINLLQKNCFSIDNIHLDSFRTPGYPYFIAFIYFIFGVKPWLVLLFQNIINLFSIALLFQIVKRLFSNDKIAIIACILFAFDLHVIMYTCEMFTETLFTFLLLVSLQLFIIAINSNKYFDIFLCGIVISLMTLVRPIAEYFPIVFLFFILIRNNQKFSHRILFSFCFLFGSFFLTIPWMYRNYRQFDHFAVSSVKQYNLLFYGVTYTEAVRTGRNVNDINEEFAKKALSLGAHFDDYTNVYARDFYNGDYYNVISKQYLKDHFSEYLKVHIKNSLFSFLNVGTKGFLSMLHFPEKEFKDNQLVNSNIFTILKDIFTKRSLVEIFLIAYLACFLFVVYLLSFAGIYFLWKEKNIYYLFLLLGVIAYFILLLGPVGNSARFKVPVIPFYSTLSAFGLYKLLGKYRGLIKRNP